MTGNDFHRLLYKRNHQHPEKTQDTEASQSALLRFTSESLLELTILLDLMPEEITEQLQYYGSTGSNPEEAGNRPKISNVLDVNDRILRTWARLAGFLYVVIIVCGFTAELGIRGKLFDFGSAEMTADNVVAHADRLRRGILVELLMSCADVFVAVLLTTLLLATGASAMLTVAMGVFRLMQQAVITGNLLHLFAVGLLLDTNFHGSKENVASLFASSASSQATSPVAAWALFYALMHKYGYFLALVFFGISMVLWGVAVIEQHRDKAECRLVFPKWMGLTLVLAGIGYLVDTILNVWLTDYDSDSWTSTILLLPAIVAELCVTVWLSMGRIIID